MQQQGGAVPRGGSAYGSDWLVCQQQQERQWWWAWIFRPRAVQIAAATSPRSLASRQNSRRVCVRCARNLAGKVNISNDSTPQNKQKAVELVCPHIVCLMKRDG